jgi:hypothetical protein
MQVMPFWMRLIGDGDIGKLFHMQTNLRFGCVILRHYMDREKGDAYMALGRYNGSRGQPQYPNAVSARSGAGWWRSRSRSDTVTAIYRKRERLALFSLVSAIKEPEVLLGKRKKLLIQEWLFLLACLGRRCPVPWPQRPPKVRQIRLRARAAGSP